jgi:hypothetical protein
MTRVIKILYAFTIIVIIGFVRQLYWNNNSLNPDELEWIYLLIRAKYNSIPFLGFTAHTSGPLSIYFLYPINFFTDYPTLKSLRIFQFLVCIIPSLIILYHSISKEGKWLGVHLLALFFITSDFPLGSDFFAYNTEYQLILFTSIIYFLQKDSNPSFLKVSITSFLTISLFFVKSQSIILVLYFIVSYFIFLRITDQKKSNWLIYSTLISLLIYYLLIQNLGITDHFYREYLYKNFVYSNVNKTDYFNHFLPFLRFVTDSLNFYWLCLFLLLLFVAKKYFRNNVWKPINYNLIKSSLFFLASFATIFVSTNNFSHYKILLFLPMSLLFGELMHLIAINNLYKKLILISGLTIVFFMFNYSFFGDILNHIKLHRISEYRLNRGTKNVEIKGLNYSNRKIFTVNTAERQAALTFMTNHLKQKNKDKIFILGWFVAQGYYYELLKLSGPPISKSSHNGLIMEYFKYKDWENYNKEEISMLYELKQENPEWIMDSEEILIPLNNFPLKKYISENYKVVYKTESITIYHLK